MAKMVKKRRDDVGTLQDWVNEEVRRLRNECAIEILELAQGEAPDRYSQIADKINANKEIMSKLDAIHAWCMED